MKKQERGGEYMKKLWELAKGFAAEEDAVGVVEIILILVGILTTYYRVGIRCIE